MTEEGTANSRKNSTARPLAPPSRLISFFALLLLSLPLIFALPGCSCGDDDDSARDGIAYDDSGFDDDADDDDNAGDDDDDDDDDDADDDDADDDSDDDDSAIDDDADDDSGDDDADDDDSSDDDTFDDDSTDDDTVARPYDEDLAENCIELPDDVVDLGLTELSPFQPGCPDSFVSEDGIEICVVRGSGVRTLNLVLEGDVVVDSQGNVHVITTYGRDLRVYSLAAEKIATGQVRPADWTWERIAFMARYPRMTIDENDVFHIAYSDGWNHEVRYATGAPGGPWEIEAVDSMSSFGSRGYDFKNTQGAISLGPDGSPHMAWKNWDELSVRYGHRVAGIWETEIAFDETGVGVDVGYQIALDIAPDDSAHVVSEAGEQSPWAFGGLIYASKPDGGSFTTAWIPVLFSTNPEVVAESVGHAFISYYGTGLLTDFAPRIAEKTGDTWSYYVVGPPSGQISFNSVFFDAENAPTAFFTWGDANDTFRRVRRTGKTWTSEPYYSPADDGQVTKAKYCSNTYAAATMMSDDQSSMNWLYTNGTDAITSRIYDGHISADHDAYALGPDDSLHAVYYRINPSPAFIYLTNTGGQWREEIIAEGKNVGYYPDIAIDSLNRPHVAFWDHSIGQEKYAHRTESNWLIENIAGGAAAKIALLQNDAPVLLKTDNISLLQFSEKIGSAWHTEDIATGTTDGADIAISEINDVHIVFRREKSFYHATKNNGTWIEDFLLDVVSTSGNASVALDSLNRVHVAVDDITGANRFIYYSSNRSGAWDAFSLQQVIGTSEEGHITLGADDTVYIYTSSTKLVTNCTERAISGDGFNWERDWIDCADAGVSDAFIASDGSHIIAGASSGLILYSLPGI